MQEYGTLLNSFNDFLIYDERKGRVLHSRHLNKAQFYEMWRFHFNRLRPEFSKEQNQEFALAQRLTRGIFGYLRFHSGRELAKCWRLTQNDYPTDHCQEILINHLNYTAPTPGQPLFTKVTNWEDASKSYNYVQQVAAKIEAFGLNYPNMSRPMNQEQQTQLEEQLYQYFSSLLSN